MMMTMCKMQMTNRDYRTCFWRKHFRVLAMSVAASLMTGAIKPPMMPLPEKVTFQSADGKTRLTAYLFKPEGSHPAKTPAVVMLHGRRGPYSTLAKGRYDASTLSRRHQEWGHLWARQGYAALLVDSFGSRGYPKGFPRFSYGDRPAELDEVTVRPLDADGALVWLNTRSDILSDRIALQGWSNGGSAALATMVLKNRAGDFRGALVFYAGCALKGQFRSGLLPYAPVRMFHGTDDEQVSSRRCADLAEKSRANGADIEITLYPGAMHDFDDPGERHQRVAANASASSDAKAQAVKFFAEILKSAATSAR